MCWCNLYGVIKFSKNQIEIRFNEMKRRNSTNINPNTTAAIHNYDDRSFHEDITRDDTFTLFKGVVGLQQGYSSSSP
jgi:hypothetical protein